jgi:hypothetical protein
MYEMFNNDSNSGGRMKAFLILMLGLFIFINYMAWLQQQRMGV